MLTEKQVMEIKSHLEKAQNPLFFFDNDADGLCSFLLLQRWIGRGKGFPVKSFPDLTVDYFRKVNELNADYIFILDKPVVSEDFFKEVKQVNIPVVWIDHHGAQSNIPDFVNYYDPTLNKPPSNEPVTALCYQITNKKDDLWIAVMGCVADGYVPDFYEDFKKDFPDLTVDSKDAFHVLYSSQIGQIAQTLGNGLKDRTTNVISMLKFLMRAAGPYDVLEETNKNHTMHERSKQIQKKFNELIDRAKILAKSSDKILFFKYGGDLSISAELANKLCYLFPEKVVVVAYMSGIKANVSIRGKNVKKLVEQAIKGLENATGGGHEMAVGAQVRIEDVDKFKENLNRILV